MPIARIRTRLHARRKLTDPAARAGEVVVAVAEPLGGGAGGGAVDDDVGRAGRSGAVGAGRDAGAVCAGRG